MSGQAARAEPGDILLVEAARNGDRSAFGRLYDRFAPMVHGILLARVPPIEVDDLVQDVFLLAFTQVHSTRNRASDYHRRPKATFEVTGRCSEGEIAGPLMIHPEGLEPAKVLALIRTLPEAYRETLVLRLVEGMTGPEIAQRTGLTAGSVRVNLHRGMQQLRQKLG